VIFARSERPEILKICDNNKLESSWTWNVLANYVMYCEILWISKKLHNVLVQNWQ